MSTEDDECLAWFVPKVLRMRPPGSSYHIIAPGWTYHVGDPEEMRMRNLIAWENPIDALHSKGATICRVRLRGTVIHGRGRMRKMLYANEMTVLWLVKWGRLLERFVCDLTLRTLHDDRIAGQAIEPLFDDLIQQKQRAIHHPDLRDAYRATWGANLHSEAYWKAFRALVWPTNEIVGGATCPYFVGQSGKYGDASARQSIRYSLSCAREKRENLDEEISRLLSDSFASP